MITPSLGAVASDAGGIVYSEWVDLTEVITAAVAGGLDSDPDSEGASLTVTTTTGTVDGETVPCNEFGWTADASINDGVAEAMRVSLGTLVALFPAYDPATHGWQIVADRCAQGTLNSVQPLLFVGAQAGGGTPTALYGAGFALATSSLINAVYLVTSSDSSSGSRNPNTAVPQLVTTLVTPSSTAAQWLITCQWVDASLETSLVATVTPTTSDELHLLLGTNNTTSAAISGTKMRFRVRTFSGIESPLATAVL